MKNVESGFAFFRKMQKKVRKKMFAFVSNSTKKSNFDIYYLAHKYGITFSRSYLSFASF